MKTIVNYAKKVKEQHALNKTLAPVETDLTSASKAYAVGQKFIHDGVLYQAKTAIAQGAALVLNTNYEAADDVSSEIQTLTNNLDDEIETRAKLGAHNLFHLSSITNASADITTVDNGDGTVTVSGTPTSTQSFFLKSDHPLEVGQYNFFGLADTTNLGIYKLYLYNGNTVIKEVLGTSITVNPSDVHTEVRVAVRSIDNNVAVSGTIKPMMCLSTDASTVYQHYAMTNRELTEKINEEFLQNTASISAQINYKDVYLFTTNGGSSSGSAQYSSAYLVFGQATTQITYFALKEGTEITPSVDGTTFTLTASTSITMAYRKL